MVDPSGETFTAVDGGQSSAWLAASLIDWRSPVVRCQSPLCSRERPRPALRVHPIPKRTPTWGGAYIHATSGLAGYPALDFGGARGTPVLAVERGYVREFGSADVGDALYLRGDSGIDYWYGHIRRVAARGQAVRPGQVVGRTVHHPNGDHLHLGANANIGGKIIGRRRAGTDVITDPTWTLGVVTMRQISRAPRLP
jgi:murein DD-endopeptidase MepM/ murein hydrolase activator NlpD